MASSSLPSPSPKNLAHQSNCRLQLQLQIQQLQTWKATNSQTWAILNSLFELDVSTTVMLNAHVYQKDDCFQDLFMKFNYVALCRHCRINILPEDATLFQYYAHFVVHTRVRNFLLVKKSRVRLHLCVSPPARMPFQRSWERSKGLLYLLWPSSGNTGRISG